MSLRHALIGLLRQAPASGYDLMQVFTVSLAHIWPATKSQVYAELSKLADAGLLAVISEGPRGRKEYAPTEAGLAELRWWMLETTPEIHPRSELLLRVFLLGALTRDQAGDYLMWVQERAVEDVTALNALHDSIPWDDSNGDLLLYGRLVLEFGRRLSELTRDWTVWATGQIATRN
jgi:PadR family transcriptional regulator, regulatory protein AphA